MPIENRIGGVGENRKVGINTLFINNLSNADFDLNAVKQNYLSNRINLDNSKLVGGNQTGKLLYTFGYVDLFTFKETLSQWTIEYWIYPTSYGGSYGWFKLVNSAGSLVLNLGQSGANVYTEWTGTGGGYIFDNPSNNTAHHVAVTYNNGTVKLYWDGILRNTFSLTINSIDHTLIHSNVQASTTNIFGLRVSKMVRYTSNFTPSTSLLDVD